MQDVRKFETQRVHKNLTWNYFLRKQTEHIYPITYPLRETNELSNHNQVTKSK